MFFVLRPDWPFLFQSIKSLPAVGREANPDGYRDLSKRTLRRAFWRPAHLSEDRFYLILFISFSNELSYWFKRIGAVSALGEKAWRKSMKWALRNLPCLTSEARSLEDFSERRRFLVLGTATFFVYFFLLKKKSKSQSGLRTVKKWITNLTLIFCELEFILVHLKYQLIQTKSKYANTSWGNRKQTNCSFPTKQK